MSDETTEQVLEMARQRVLQQKEQAYIQSEEQRQARMQRERPWLYLLAGVFGTLLLALLLTPGEPLHEKLIHVMQGVCSQQHNAYLAGMQLPICARCTGIYTTFLTTLFAFWALGRSRAAGLPPWHIAMVLVAFVVIMGLDGINSMLNEVGAPTAYTPLNEVRVVTGMGMGVSIGLVVQLIFNQALRRNADNQQPLIKNWFELLGIIGFNIVLLAAIFGNLNFMFWPLAVLSFLGMTGALYLINVLACGLLMGYGERVTHLHQLARPATVAIFSTSVFLAGLAFLRAWLEGQGLTI
jgi:uncharacterized membrane protein